MGEAGREGRQKERRTDGQTEYKSSRVFVDNFTMHSDTTWMEIEERWRKGTGGEGREIERKTRQTDRTERKDARNSRAALS